LQDLQFGQPILRPKMTTALLERFDVLYNKNK